MREKLIDLCMRATLNMDKSVSAAQTMEKHFPLHATAATNALSCNDLSKRSVAVADESRYRVLKAYGA